MTRLLTVLMLGALLSGCKAMGGLGHLANGLGHVASAAGHVASAAGQFAAPVARVAAQAAPIAVRVAETAIEIAALAPDPAPPANPVETPDETPPAPALAGPLIDNHDPCNACPDDVACDQWVGAGGAACRWTPPGAFTRCESGLPR